MSGVVYMNGKNWSDFCQAGKIQTPKKSAREARVTIFFRGKIAKWSEKTAPNIDQPIRFF
jgi:hypothetical protein